MRFHILIPARLASTRLPDKALAEIAGLPMVVRVARNGAQAGALSVVVATDHERIRQACVAHGVRALMTRDDHASGSDRLAEACDLLGLDDEEIVVNVQGDEPLMPPALIRRCAELLGERSDCVMATVAHPIHSLEDWHNPNVVKTVLDAQGRALYFTRAPVPFLRDGIPSQENAGSSPVSLTPAEGGLGVARPWGRSALPTDPAALRHLGLYAYRAGFLRRFPRLSPAPLERTEALEQLRVLWHGERIAVHVTDSAPGTGVDTPEDLERVRALLSPRT